MSIVRFELLQFVHHSTLQLGETVFLACATAFLRIILLNTGEITIIINAYIGNVDRATAVNSGLYIIITKYTLKRTRHSCH